MEFLTTAEVSLLLRVSRETARAMLERGDLEGFRSGRIVRIRRASVEKFTGVPLEAPQEGQPSQ